MPSSVTVAVRVRPVAEGEARATRTTPNSITLSPKKCERTFAFDRVYGEDATQEQIYADLGAPILRRGLQGFNGTIFAYGQTGSGKTHTMLGEAAGDGSAAGIIPRLGEELFFQARRCRRRSAPSAQPARCV